ncbi:alpha/beta fold hydrolase [Chitinimonas koreensis]|uniref:alpha/beta fold hydrolase n=1 Tax=Chitinimonas koreensis TaxID=356302 RepID=UPI003570B273
MVHGAIANARTFYSERGKGLGPWLARRGYDVYVLDLRGRGASLPKIDRRARHGQTESIRDDLPAALAEIVRLRGESVALHLVAHSWAGCCCRRCWRGGRTGRCACVRASTSAASAASGYGTGAGCTRSSCSGTAPPICGCAATATCRPRGWAWALTTRPPRACARASAGCASAAGSMATTASTMRPRCARAACRRRSTWSAATTRCAATSATCAASPPNRGRTRTRSACSRGAAAWAAITATSTCSRTRRPSRRSTRWYSTGYARIAECRGGAILSLAKLTASASVIHRFAMVIYVYVIN